MGQEMDKPIVKTRQNGEGHFKGRKKKGMIYGFITFQIKESVRTECSMMVILIGMPCQKSPLILYRMNAELGNMQAHIWQLENIH